MLRQVFWLSYQPTSRAFPGEIFAKRHLTFFKDLKSDYSNTSGIIMTIPSGFKLINNGLLIIINQPAVFVHDHSGGPVPDLYRVPY